jgi:hypothetical protein
MPDAGSGMAGWFVLIVGGIIWGCKLGILGLLLRPRERCPHGFRTPSYCPTCNHFLKVRKSD